MPSPHHPPSPTAPAPRPNRAPSRAPHPTPPTTRTTTPLARALGPLVILTALVSLTACSTPSDDSPRPPGTASPALTVTTDKGRVAGTEKDGVRSFQGIPYAAPPVAERRWRPPAPAAAWRGVRQTTAPGPKCVQAGRNGAPAPGSSEDCLYLNVTAPRPARAAKPRPVVVWLHGGSFKTGSGAEYDPARMARDGDVVVVTVNSRLGVFGFFGHPGLDDPAGYGLQDQQAALRWVRANASAFGGDPGQVTLMGESTGGASVCAQLVSPRSAGLFHRAVIQSGACHQNWPRNTLGPGAEPWTYWTSRRTVHERGLAAARALRCAEADVSCLRGRSTQQVLRLNNRFNQPAYGTATLPRHPARALADGAFHRVPVLLGTTRDEHRLYAAQFALDRPISRAKYGQLLRTTFGPANAARIERRYPAGDSPGSPGVAWAAVGTDRTWVCPSLESARLMARHVPVYGYEFADRNAPGRKLRPGFPLGAYHASELPYLFDLRGITLDDAQARLSARMLRYWTDFAKSGTPGGTWERFPRTLRLLPARDVPIDAAAEHHCGFWSSLR